ncbi:MAG: RNA methyltransferase [Candidatus Melainabacteria bacterium]|nr:RNA methyltransferase [Candidatus Melainabacteria bacterium]
MRENKGYRYETKRIVLSGIKLIRELSERFPLRTLLLGDECELALQADETYRVTPQILKKVTGLESPEPIAAEIDMPVPVDFSKARFILVLDGISDPGNLGTLLRTGLAMGWECVYLLPGSADPYNEKAIRAAKGATFLLPWKSISASGLIEILQEKKIALFAADAHGKDFSSCSFSSPLALALGNEAHGLCPELKKCAQTIAIPMKGAMESLNVASAGAILMHAMRGQR